MSYSACYKLIRERVEAQLENGGDGGNNIAVRYPNQHFQPPTDANWIDLHILPVGRNQADFGESNTRNRQRGVLQLNVFTPEGDGDKASLALADRVLSAVEKRSVDQLVYLAGRIDLPRSQGGNDVGKFWMTPVVIPFYYDDFS